MSVALADFLIAVSDPLELKKYQETPDQLLSEFSLTSGDLEALQSRHPGWIKVQSLLEDDRMDLTTDHPDCINAKGFPQNNQESNVTATTCNTNTTNSTNTTTTGQPNQGFDVIDEDGNPGVAVPEE